MKERAHIVGGTTSVARSAWGYWIRLVGPFGLVVLSPIAVAGGLWKVLLIGWIAFAAMAVGAAVGARVGESRGGLVWGYGLTSGAMIASASAFLVPQAIGYDPKIGGFGVAAGIIGGFAAHTIGHRFANPGLPLDSAVVRITAHALSAGLVIGVVYAAMPGLGLLLGLAIVSHKGPAGYAAARRLVRSGKPASSLLLPASAVGVPAILVGLLGLSMPAAADAAVFGFAAGIFLHVAVDFLPRCEAGGDLGEVARGATEDTNVVVERFHSHAVVSTVIGGLVVFAAWMMLMP